MERKSSFWISFSDWCVLYQKICQKDAEVFTDPYVLGLLECEWDAFIREKKKVGIFIVFAPLKL